MLKYICMKKIGSFISKILTAIGDCIIPTLPVLVGVGMIKVLLIVLGPSVLNILSETSDTFVVLSFVADAGYYFLPILSLCLLPRYLRQISLLPD